ncbi:hypothetical protein V1504DRAFT_464452 [Lipomyces starkeyi]
MRGAGEPAFEMDFPPGTDMVGEILSGPRTSEKDGGITLILKIEQSRRGNLVSEGLLDVSGAVYSPGNLQLTTLLSVK